MLIVTGLIVLFLIFGAAYYLKSKSPSNQTALTSSPTSATTSSNTAKAAKSDQELIKEALVAKNNWNSDEISVTVSKNDGTYATGLVGPVTPGPGGGAWFAKKVNGNWKIVYDGNGIIMCDNLTDYPDFPNSLIPQCYDANSGNLVTR